MAIKTIEILNVMVFKRHLRKNNAALKSIEEGDSFNDGFKIEFCDGINVLIGENGVGKTTILKMIYAATQWSIKQTDQGKTKRLIQFFSNSLKDSDALKNAENIEDYCYYKVSDGTQIDIIVNASLPETREIPFAMSKILDKLSAVIDGTVILENDSFYVLKKDGQKVDFSLEAEGLRKLGLLWKLIRNGLLEKGSILLWDEPEANLNPELYPLVAEILLELQKNGVQIFLATHSYNFAKYLEIRRTNNEQVMFHNLYRSHNLFSNEMQKIFPGMDDNSEAIYSQSADKMDKIKYNHIMDADNKLLDEVYEL